MRSHAKAPTAGSTQPQAPGLGRTRFARTAVLAVAIASLLAFAATPASATLLRGHEGSFGSFSGESPQALAVDQSSGDVYALDTAGDRLLRFSSAGAPKNFSAGPNPGTNEISGLNLQDFPSFDQVAVDSSGGPSNGNIYVTQSGLGQVKVFASSGEALGTLDGSGTPGGGLGEDCGVAVDEANGDVYVASWENRVWRYSPSGATVLESDYSGGIATSIHPCGLAVAQGSLYAKDWQEGPVVGGGPLKKYVTSEFATGAPPPGSPTQLADKATAVATDPSNGDVYVDEGDKISVFNSGGGTKYSFGSGGFGASKGVAVRGGGNAYVSDQTNHRVDIYGPFSAPPPLLETKAATSVKHTKATLHGHLDPNGSLPITGCVFEWGTDTSYSEAPIACAEGSSFSAAADVSAELTGLTPGTTYHLRLHVTTTSGGFNGEDRSFEAVPPSSVPEAATGQGAMLSATSTQLNGSVNPSANPLTDCNFEYVTDLAFQGAGFSDLSSGGSVPCDQAPGSIPVDFEDHEVSATVTGLDPEQIYRFRLVVENTNGAGASAAALVLGPPLVETVGSPTRTATTARLDSRVSPHGAATTYHFEYVTDAEFQASEFAGASSTPNSPITANEVQILRLNSAPSGQFKLTLGGFTTPDLSAVATAEEVQSALRALPSIGSPNVRVTASTPPSYSFTFVGGLANTDVGQIVASPGSTPSADLYPVETQVDGGPHDVSSFVSAEVTGLQPATAYRYRVVADNGNPAGPTFGGAMTFTTRASDAPLSHGHLAGPPGSDRAWEQVNAPDIGGNLVSGVRAFSDDGNRAVYNVFGGSPDSEVGSDTNQLFAERTVSGWKTRSIYPTRIEATGNSWREPAGRSDLSQLLAVNFDTSSGGSTDVWRLSPDAPAQHVFGAPHGNYDGAFTAVSDDGSRIIAAIDGNIDPDHPTPGNTTNYYDVTSGAPHLISLLPDGSVLTCGVSNRLYPTRSERWVSADGAHAFFEGRKNCPDDQGQGLYVRDLEAETTTQISSGASTYFIRSTADAVFFTTVNSLDPEDEGGDDVYRYDLDSGSLDCVTCFSGFQADVTSGDGSEVAVSDDGSRVYFTSPHRLLPGAGGINGIYRVEVADHALAYVAPVAFEAVTRDSARDGNAISPDGSVFVFRSAFPGLNSLNGPQNDGTAQYYRYDDDDRSLVCVSCPADGSAPRGEASKTLGSFFEAGPNVGPLSSAGDLVFDAPTPLVPADQNTARPAKNPAEGIDIYEWRDGRPLLITDGLATAAVHGLSAGAPHAVGITPSGHDVFFTQAAQLTPDAIDGYDRLYDARVGGGFEFPPPPPPCPLEACQGTPKGAPEESRPSSADYAGAGNIAASPSARCRKGKVRRRGRCVAKHSKKRAKRSQHRANHDRRASR